jgi:hypothetical protein
VGQNRPKGLEGVIACAAPTWFLYWELWESEEASLQGRISELCTLADRVLLQHSKREPIDPSLTTQSNGVTLQGGESLNILFPR